MANKSNKSETAVFAAGCFWGVQDYFDHVPGIIETIVGYTGGHVPNPSYEDVSSDTTGHTEAIKITYDPEVVNYDILLKHFFKMHDPTQHNRQGADFGEHYKTAIYYIDDNQKKAADKYINFLNKSSAYDKPIATEVTKFSEFYKAEEEHQKYAQKTGHGGCHVRYAPLD